jgi:hypothetical protein
MSHVRSKKKVDSTINQWPELDENMESAKDLLHLKDIYLH